MTVRFTDPGAGSAGGVGAEDMATRIGAAVLAEAEAGDERSVALSFSSEAPVLRDYHFGTGWEVLGHLPAEVDLARVAANAVPLLADHRRSLDAKLGSVTSAQIVGARGRAVVRFAETPEADAMLARVRAGEVQSVSVGYAAHALEVVGDLDGIPVVRVTRWELLEISLVATPADPSVGIGRSLAPALKGLTMTTPNPAPVTPAPAAPATAVMEATRAERARVRELQAGAQRFDLPADMLAAAIEDGTTVGAFQRQVLEHIGSDTSTATRQRMNAPAIRRGGEREYSLLRAVAAEYSGNWSEAGFEREVAQETTRAVGKSATGFYVPPAVLGRAVITTATAPSLIGTDQMASAFIDALRPEVQVMSLGATVLPGLVENVAVPRMVSGTGAEWVAEGVASTESSPVFDSVPLSLKQLSARSQLSRRQLKQSLPGLDVLLKNDLRRSIGIELDRAAISGAGTATVPRGILNTVGIGSVAIGTNGGTPHFPFLTRLMAEVEADNVAGTSYGWLTNHFVKGSLLSTQTADGAQQMILQRNGTDWAIAGYKAAFSNLVPANGTKGTGTNLSTLIFGNWSDLLIGQWGGIDLVVDDMTGADTGNVRIVAHSEWDIAVRHPESFASIRDAVTTAA
ncbi:phage major capsid protein [Paracoccus sp. IB05]|uniref:phage major capsid protein n=1 Tax=Paracoccus sp. IB05 TaxID=2779367 RepID=UPI0018E7DED7|nr:phage major capsid protein [Paracoccus sp. IB05]MBJ2152637.1 phage major capsid protein [Paracoccus sp. IB05]